MAKEAKKSEATDTKKATGKTDKPKVKKENHEIEFHFPDSVMQDKGLKLAKALQEKGNIEAEKKQANDGFKVRIDEQEDLIEKLSDEITAGFEIKMVTCDVVRNFGSGKREYWYGKGADYKKYSEEPLRDSDHQIELDLTDEVEKSKGLLLSIKAGDYCQTKMGTTVKITEEDVVNGIQSKGIERLSTQDEINKFELNSTQA